MEANILKELQQLREELQKSREEQQELKMQVVAKEKKLLTLNELGEYAGYKVGYIYKLTHLKQIPHYKPGGKNIYFDRDEIDAWLKRNRIATATETEQAAIAYTVDRNINGKRK
jgi:excisionase family DNA binding protein